MLLQRLNVAVTPPHRPPSNIWHLLIRAATALVYLDPLARLHLQLRWTHLEHLHFRWETPRLPELSNNKQRWQHGSMFTQRHLRGARRVCRQSAQRDFQPRIRLILMLHNLVGLVHQRAITIWVMGL